METSWSLEDYKDYYHELAGIYENDGLPTFSANIKAKNQTLDLFTKNEQPTKEEVKELLTILKGV